MKVVPHCNHAYSGSYTFIHGAVKVKKAVALTGPLMRYPPVANIRDKRSSSMMDNYVTLVAVALRRRCCIVQGVAFAKKLYDVKL